MQWKSVQDHPMGLEADRGKYGVNQKHKEEKRRTSGCELEPLLIGCREWSSVDIGREEDWEKRIGRYFLNIVIWNRDQSAPIVDGQFYLYFRPVLRSLELPGFCRAASRRAIERCQGLHYRVYYRITGDATVNGTNSIDTPK